MKVSEKLRLEAPTMDYAKQLMEYREEFFNEGRNTIDGGGGLHQFDNGKDYLDWVESFGSKETVPSGFVPSSTFLAINEDNRLVGIINIRHELNEMLFNVGGHIGYGIRESERRKGYATEMLKLGLEKCKDLGLEKVLVTCNKENLGSAKTILNNNGVFENEMQDGDNVFKRFWIEV